MVAADGRGFVDRMPEPDGAARPGSRQDELDHYVAEFTRTGFTGGINWYRNLDRNWELTADLADAAGRGARRSSSAARSTRCSLMSPPARGEAASPTTAARCSSRAPATGCSRSSPTR